MSVPRDTSSLDSKFVTVVIESVATVLSGKRTPGECRRSRESSVRGTRRPMMSCPYTLSQHTCTVLEVTHIPVLVNCIHPCIHVNVLGIGLYTMAY